MESTDKDGIERELSLISISLRDGAHISAVSLVVVAFNQYNLAISLAYRNGKGVCLFLPMVITTCLRCGANTGRVEKKETIPSVPRGPREQKGAPR